MGSLLSPGKKLISGSRKTKHYGLPVHLFPAQKVARLCPLQTDHAIALSQLNEIPSGNVMTCPLVVKGAVAQ